MRVLGPIGRKDPRIHQLVDVAENAIEADEMR